jgi:peptide/nickel transport system substrate-binding protein
VVIDDYTAKFVQKEEFCPFAPALIGETQAIIPKDTYLEMGKEAFNANPIGSGPFKFVEWKRGEHITLVRNEEYWMTGRKLCYANGYDPGNEIVCEKPYLEKIIFRPIPTLATAMLELEKGGIDIADNIPAEDIPRFKEMPEVTVQQRPSLSYFYVGFNMSLSPYNDIRFRKAVYQSFSMDDAVFSIFKGLTGIRAYGAVPPALWANDREYLKEEIALPVNDEEAARLFAKLREEGVIPKGFTTTVYCPPDPRRIKLAEIIATNLIEHGIPADVQSLEWGAYLDLLYRTEEKPEGEYGIYIIGWLGAPDPDAFLYYLFTSENAMVGAGNNFSFYMNPTVDALIKQARTTLDMEVRETAYVQAQRIIFADYVHIPAYHYIDTRGVRARVKGFEVGGPVLMRIVDPFYNVWVED